VYKRRLGTSGLEVSAIGLGCMSIDNDPDRAGKVAHLGRDHRSHQWPSAGDGREVVTEQDPPVGRDEVDAVVEPFGRGRAVSSTPSTRLAMNRA
jgi:hypothetical protein